MHDYMSFWLLAGTAAPVIALANIVLAGDTFKLIQDLVYARRMKGATEEQKDWARFGLKSAQKAAFLSYINLFVQTLVLVFALIFFATGFGGDAHALPIFAEGYGMLALAGASIFSGSAQHSLTEATSDSPNRRIVYKTNRRGDY